MIMLPPPLSLLPMVLRLPLSSFLLLLALGTATMMRLNDRCGLHLLRVKHLFLLLLLLVLPTTMLVVLFEVVEMVTMILFLVQNAAVVGMAWLHDTLGPRSVGHRHAIVLNAAARTRVTVAPMWLVAFLHVAEVMAVIPLLVEKMTVS